MKISKSKKELARIISENGGWRDGARSAAQCMGGEISFWRDTATKNAEEDWCGAYLGASNDIDFTGVKIANWHQTILSREEYFHLYPAPDADGWIEWGGEHKSPVENGVLVDVKLKSGAYHEGELLDDASWGDACGDESITAYRLHKPEKQKPEYCESVTRSIPEAKTTIEQLAADYRNRKDYADRKQEEADAAKADADEALRKLEIACEDIGLIVTPVRVEKEPELVINDWRDLRVGDIVNVVGSDNYHWKRLIGLELRVTRVGRSESDLSFAPICGEEWSHGGNTQWRFIRRP